MNYTNFKHVFKLVNKSLSLPFYLLSISIFLILIAPHLLSDGMFMDGLLYAAISNNIAEGLGSFWDLFLSNTLYTHFHEHPPLAFGLQSLFFKFLGDGMMTERIYSICTFIITGFIISKIWCKITTKENHKLAWLPLLFWFLIPLVSWSASNNMLENSMMVFTCLSVLFFVVGNQKSSALYFVFSGLMLSLGFLTKGLVSLFPLSLILWVFLFKNHTSYRRLLFSTCFCLLGLFLPFVILFVFMPESYTSLIAYFEKQVVGSLQNIQTVNNRFWIIWKVFLELLPLLIFTLISVLFSKKQIKLQYNSKWFFIFLALSLSGVFPIIISLKQRGFYLLATFPFFSLAFALLTKNYVLCFFEKLSSNKSYFKKLRFLSVLLIFIGFSLNFYFSTTIQRDKEMLKDIYTIIKIVPRNTTISISPELKNNWSLHGYFQRYGLISLDSDTINLHRFKLGGVNSSSSYDYKKTNLALSNYFLYELN